MQIENINYKINWKKFKRGTSFFVPCLDGDKAKETVYVVAKRLKMQVLAKVSIEDGVRGLRVWRL